MTTNIRFNSEPTSIVRQLCKAGYEAYIVGGAVRDYLLGKTPKDYDIATNATPEEVRRVFGRRSCQIIGRRFRLALVHYGKNTYEVSTFRREPSAKERKGRKGDDGVMIWNDNVYGTLDDDVRRRDFTVNALYADVLTGEILDKCGGMKDIKARTVHVIGEPLVRFQEDPVRMLRALKLVGQHGLKLSRPVQSALRSLAPEIAKASRSRLFEEIIKILLCGHSVDVLTQCHKQGLLEHFWPGLAQNWGGEPWRIMIGLMELNDKENRDAHKDSPDRFIALACVCLPYFLFRCENAKPEQDMLPESFDIPLEECGIPLVQARKICSWVVHELFNGYIVSREIQYDLQSVMVRVRMLLNGEMPRTSLPRMTYEYLYELLRLRSMLDGTGADALVKLPFPFEYEPEENATDSLNLEAQLELSELLSRFMKKVPRKRRRKKSKGVGNASKGDVETGEIAE